ncbi:MAG: transporter substrate-binding domain-containing protein [Desulfovibrionaceae bacterium]|nr:transporter substrate-binding domain-containing protein [Desulfovibrionaceae bacterium]
MKRLLAFLLMAGALCFSPLAAAAGDTDSTIENVIKRGALRVGFSSFVPWAMQDKEGKYIGFEIDVATRLAEDLGVRLELVPTNWDGIIPALLSGKFDVIIGSMAITPKRSLSVNFSVPYDTAYIDLTLNKEKAGHIRNLEELNNPGSIIAVRTGTTAAQAAQILLPKATLRMFNDEAPAVEEVLSGRAWAFFSSAPLPAMETLKHPDLLAQNFEFKAFSKPVAFAVRKGDLDTLNVFDGWIRVVEEEGWLQKRRDYWFKSNEWESLIQ